MTFKRTGADTLIGGDCNGTKDRRRTVCRWQGTMKIHDNGIIRWGNGNFAICGRASCRYQRGHTTFARPIRCAHLARRHQLRYYLLS